jgi:hypothetical protein
MDYNLVSDDLRILSIKEFLHPNIIERFFIKKILEDNYQKDAITKNTLGYNYLINSDHKFFTNLYSKFLDVSKNIFSGINISPNNSSKLWGYRSNKDVWASVFHDHEKTSTVNAVYYFDLSPSDSISFQKNNKVFTYSPEKYELLIFPGTLKHKPDRPLKNKIRYSINIEIITTQSAYYLFYEKL